VSSATRNSNRLMSRFMLWRWTICQANILSTSNSCTPTIKRAAYMICHWVWSVLKTRDGRSSCKHAARSVSASGKPASRMPRGVRSGHRSPVSRQRFARPNSASTRISPIRAGFGSLIPRSLPQHKCHFRTRCFAHVVLQVERAGVGSVHMRRHGPALSGQAGTRDTSTLCPQWPRRLRKRRAVEETGSTASV